MPLPLESLGTHEPSSMTNMGLQITLDLEPIEGQKDITEAYLHYTNDPNSHETSCVALRLIALGNNQYARVQSSRLFNSHAKAGTIKDVADRSKRIYVKQHHATLLLNVLLEGLDCFRSQRRRLIDV